MLRGTRTWRLFLESPETFRARNDFRKNATPYLLKLFFSYVVKGIKIKITAKFRALRRLSLEDTKRTKSPKMLSRNGPLGVSPSYRNGPKQGQRAGQGRNWVHGLWIRSPTELPGQKSRISQWSWVSHYRWHNAPARPLMRNICSEPVAFSITFRNQLTRENRIIKEYLIAIWHRGQTSPKRND